MTQDAPYPGHHGSVIGALWVTHKN